MTVWHESASESPRLTWNLFRNQDTFPGLIYNGKTEADWSFVRETTNKYSHGPVQDVNDAQLRCYTAGSGSQGAGTKAVKAGDTVGFRVDSDIGHPGPLQFYMAKAPSGATAESFDGAGNVWFKIYQDGPSFAGGQITWPSAGKKEVSVQIPRCLPDGYYLLRAEHIALHSAGSAGGAQVSLFVYENGDGCWLTWGNCSSISDAPSFTSRAVPAP